MRKEKTERQKKYGKKKVALFKGEFIDKFLQIEYIMEEIIIKFFTELPTDKTLAQAITSKSSSIEERNQKRKHFIRYFLFSDPFFGFNLKLNSVKTVMQILDGNYYKKITKNQNNIFSCISLLNELRNIIAHNVTGYKKNAGLVGYKQTKKFKGLQSQITNLTTGKPEIETNYYFSPHIDTFIISRQIQEDIFKQIDIVCGFFISYIITDHLLTQGEVKKESSILVRNVFDEIFKSQHVFGNDKGVFKLFKGIKS